MNPRLKLNSKKIYFQVAVWSQGQEIKARN